MVQQAPLGFDGFGRSPLAHSLVIEAGLVTPERQPPATLACVQTSTSGAETPRLDIASVPSGCIMRRDHAVLYTFGPLGPVIGRLLADDGAESSRDGDAPTRLLGMVDEVFASGVDVHARSIDLQPFVVGPVSLTVHLAEPTGDGATGPVAEPVATVTVQDASSSLSVGRERMREIFDMVPLAIFAVDAAGRLIYANARAAEIFATSSVDRTGWDPSDEFASGDVRLVLLRSGNDEAIRDGYSRFELDAEQIGHGLVRLHKVPAVIDEQFCLLAVCVSTMQTGRKRSRLELRETQLGRLVDLMPAPVWVIDRQRRIVQLNNAAREVAPAATSHLIGAKAHAAYPRLGPEVFGPPDTEFESLATADHPAPIVTFVELDRVFRIDRTLLPGASGSTSAMAVMLTDLSDVHGAQQELQMKNEVLEHRNAELDQFAHMASHDLRAPLRAIYAFTQMAVEDEGDEHREHLGAILNSVDRMRSVLDSLLDFATADTNPVFAEVALADVVDSVLGDLASDIAESGATIEVGDLPVLQCDETSMRRLFQNLVSNAIAYAGDAPASITISSTREYRFVEIVVSDRGIGFPQHQEREVFRPFKRLSADSHGQGIGLSMCRRIVESHHGTIRAISQIGGPTSMVIRLPRGNASWR